MESHVPLSRGKSLYASALKLEEGRRGDGMGVTCYRNSDA